VRFRTGRTETGGAELETGNDNHKKAQEAQKREVAGQDRTSQLGAPFVPSVPFWGYPLPQKTNRRGSENEAAPGFVIDLAYSVLTKTCESPLKIDPMGEVAETSAPSIRPPSSIGALGKPR
jgi:hypothetical protein